MDFRPMSASKDFLNPGNLSSVQQGWGISPAAENQPTAVRSTRDTLTLKSLGSKGPLCLSEKSGTRSASPPPPKFSVSSEHGTVIHVFSIQTEVMAKLLESKKNQFGQQCFLVGSITSQGWIIIWDLNSRRPILEQDTGLQSCSWAAIVPVENEDILTFVHSRTEGLFKFNGFPGLLKNPENVFTKVRSVAAHPGFCKPDIFTSGQNSLIAYPCVADKSTENYCKLLRTDLKEEATFPPLEPVVFVIAVEFSSGLKSVLCCSETGSLVLFNIQTARPVGVANIHGDSTDKDTDEVPFCCDFDQISSTVLIGSSHRHLYSFNLPSMELAKKVPVTNPGTICVSIRQDGRLAATGGTDKMVRIFTYPNLKPLAVLSFHSDVLSTLRFFKTPDDGYLLLSSSQDSAIAVWDIYGKE